VTGGPVVTAALLVALLGAAAISAVRLWRHRRSVLVAETAVGRALTEPEADVSHLVMNLAMAAMAGPWFGAAARVAVLAVLAALVLALGVSLARGAGPGLAAPGRRAALAYHLVAAAVMLAATALMPAGHAMSRMPAGPDMPDMPDMPGMSGPPALPAAVGVALLVAAGLFAVDALATAAVAVAAPARVPAVTDPSGSGNTAVAAPARVAAGLAPATPRVAAVPHVVMDVAMVAMLVAAH
jgi:hypothetical protein